MHIRIGLAVLAGLGCFSAGSAAADATVNSVNTAALKAIFDNRQIPATIEDGPNGLHLIQAKVGNQWILASAADCPNKDQNAACHTVMLLSAAWKLSTTADQMQDFMHNGPAFAAALRLEGGEPMLRYVFDVSDGVGPMYIENRMAEFYAEEQVFEKYLLSLGNAGGGSKTGGFAKEGGSAANLGAIEKAPNPAGFAAAPGLPLSGKGLAQ